MYAKKKKQKQTNKPKKPTYLSPSRDCNDVIFTELAAGFGTSAKMYYDTTLQEAFARGLKAHPNHLPTTLKQTFMLGRYLLSEYNGVFYSKSQNLGRELCRAYDKVFEEYDVLLMPTVPMKAATFPSSEASLQGRVTQKNVYSTVFSCENTFLA